MKILILAFALVLTINLTVPAKMQETVEIRTTASKTADRGRVRITFLEVVNDSRCPENATCVWAGNATVKFAVSKGKSVARTIELNTNTGAKTATVYGYNVRLEHLTPPPDPARMHAHNIHTATLVVTKAR